MSSTHHEPGSILGRSYAPLGQSEGRNDTGTTAFDVNNGQWALTPESERSKRSVVALSTLILIALVPVLSVAIWGGLNNNRPDGWALFSSAPIGGRFTQSQAKAVDLVCGAALAPMLLVTFNYIWFTCARVAAINELDKRPATLRTLSIASATNAGSYNVFAIWQLIVRSRAPRVMLLGCLILCAAVANTALTNVIAYEAYTIDTAPSTNMRLQYLWDEQVLEPMAVGYKVSEMYQFDQNQTATISQQFTGMLTGVSIGSARTLLNDSEYYMVNATAASLNALPGAVIELPSVPAAKYSIQCAASTPNIPFVQQQGEQQVTIGLSLNTTKTLPATYINAYYPGQITTLETAYNEQYSFLGFPNGFRTNESYFGFLTSFDDSNNTLDTSFGTIKPTAVNMSATEPGFTGTKAIMSWWGLRCWMTRTPGTANLQRAANATWTARTYTWNDDQKAVTTDWALENLQIALDYSAPGSTLPGIGSALVWNENGTDNLPPANIDYQTSSLNLLYAECETKRIVFETAAMNQSRAQPDYFYNVDASQQTQVYQITYVPFILFVGEVAVFVATIICLILTASTWRSTSGRTLRKVDVLRFVVDSVAGLRDDEGFRDLRHTSNTTIEDWADKYFIKYRNTGGSDDERPGVNLEHAIKRD